MLALSTDDEERVSTSRIRSGIERLAAGYYSVHRHRLPGFVYIPIVLGVTSIGIDAGSKFARSRGLHLDSAGRHAVCRLRNTTPFARSALQGRTHGADFTVKNDYLRKAKPDLSSNQPCFWRPPLASERYGMAMERPGLQPPVMTPSSARMARVMRVLRRRRMGMSVASNSASGSDPSRYLRDEIPNEFALRHAVLAEPH